MTLSPYLVARKNNSDIIDHNGTLEGVLTLIASRAPGERIFQDESGKLAKAKSKHSIPANADLNLFAIFTHISIRMNEKGAQALPKQLLSQSLSSIIDMKNKYCDPSKINCIAAILLGTGFDPYKLERTSAETLEKSLNNQLMKYIE